MGLAKEVRRHRSALRTNTVLAVAEQAEYGIGTHVPTRPGERRISIHVLYLKIGSRIEKQLNGVLGAEGRRAMQGSLRFGSTIPHEAAGFCIRFGYTIRLCTMAKQHANRQIVSEPICRAQRGMERRFSRVGQGSIDVCALFNEKLTKPPVPVKRGAIEVQIVAE